MTYDSGRNTPHQKSLYSPDSPPPEDYQVRLVSRGVSEYHVGRAPLLNRARDVGDTCLLRKIHGFFKQSISLLEKVLTQVGWVHHAGEARHVADRLLHLDYPHFTAERLRQLYGFPEGSLRVFGAIVANKYPCIASISRALRRAFLN